MAIKKNVVPKEDPVVEASDPVFDIPVTEPYPPYNDPNPVDSAEQASLMADLANAVVDQMKQQEMDNSMSSISPEEYKKHQPGITVTPSSDPKANVGNMTPRDREDLINRLKARTATDADMANIDESMVMDLPFIKAADFSIPGQYDPKPRDPSIRFRWVNCVNALQSNMQRFMALGFTIASRDDVNEDKTPLAESMIKGTEIHQYDVVLMKIPVLQLMALYKKNVMDSLWKLDSIQKGGVAAAQQTFADLVGQDPEARSGLNRTRVATGREPVTFSHT